MKRKAERVLESYVIEVLVRDAGDDRYPYPAESEKDKVRARRLCVYRFDGCHYDGLHLLRRSGTNCPKVHVRGWRNGVALRECHRHR